MQLNRNFRLMQIELLLLLTVLVSTVDGQNQWRRNLNFFKRYARYTI